MKKLGISTVFIALSNIGKKAYNDRNIIVGDWKNSDGIAQCIEKLTSIINLKEDGGIEI